MWAIRKKKRLLGMGAVFAGVMTVAQALADPPGQAPAPAATGTAAVDWNKEWDALCEYDDFCDFDRIDHDKTKGFVGMSRTGVEFVRHYLDTIRAASKRYDVPPEAVIGAIMADQSLTPEVASARDGLGIIYPTAVQDLEDWAAAKEGRMPRKGNELYDALDEPVANIYYIAAIVADAKEKYRSIAGFDIGQNPEWMATLYNLGKPQAKAESLRDRREQAKKEGKAPPTPRVNFFGFFVKQNLAEIQALAKESQKPMQSAQEFKNTECGAEFMKATLVYGAALEAKARLAERKSGDSSKCRTENITNDGYWKYEECLITSDPESAYSKPYLRTAIFNLAGKEVSAKRIDDARFIIASLVPRECRTSLHFVDPAAVSELARLPTKRDLRRFKKEKTPIPSQEDPLADIPE